jgi:hypothetical protein
MISSERADRIDLQKHILPILVTLPDGNINCVGTGFVSVANGRQAHFVTAAHVLDEIRKIDNPHPKHHPSMPDIMRPVLYRSELKCAKPRAIYFDGTSAHIAAIEAAVEMSKVDVALCSIRFNDDVPSDIAFTSRFAFDSAPIKTDETIVAIGYARMNAAQLPTTNAQAEYAFRASWVCNKGKVTAAYPKQGPTGQKGPCFEVDIPFLGGMSGGPVFTWNEKGPFVRGFVMMGEDRIEEGDHGPVSFALAGMIWPLMLMPVGLPNSQGSLSSARCLIDLEQEGIIIDKGRAHDHIKCQRDTNLQIVSAHWE